MKTGQRNGFFISSPIKSVLYCMKPNTKLCRIEEAWTSKLENFKILIS